MLENHNYNVTVTELKLYPFPVGYKNTQVGTLYFEVRKRQQKYGQNAARM